MTSGRGTISRSSDGFWSGIFLSGLILVSVAPIGVRADGNADTLLEQRALKLQIAPRETRSMLGHSYTAIRPSIVQLTITSEHILAAILAGSVRVDQDRPANAGTVILLSLDGQKPQRFLFDAARYRQSVSLEGDAEADAALGRLERRQSRARFFGLIEPVGANAAAPISPQAEAMRQDYLGEATILELRRLAKGNRAQLRRITAERFASSIALGDTSAVASLIDPAPFAQASLDPAIWKQARMQFATQLTNDTAFRVRFKSSLDSTGVQMNTSQGDAEVGAPGPTRFVIRLVDRDRAAFISSLEAPAP
jgi:hypothetical protein